MSLSQDFVRAFKTAYAESEKMKLCYEKKAKGKNVGDKGWTNAMTEVLNMAANELGFTDIKRERGYVDFRWYKADQNIAVEHENNYKGILDEELPKLLDIQADLRVLITYIPESDFSENNGENFAKRVEKSVLEQSSTHKDSEILLLLNRYGRYAYSKDPKDEPWIGYLWHKQVVREKLLVP